VRAWQLDHPRRPLVLRRVDDPAPDLGEVVIEVRAAGLCHSDVSFADGTLSSRIGRWPIILGHEIAGVITAVGAGVTSLSAGDRVGVPAMTSGPGVAVDGGFAELVAVRQELVSPLPDGLPFTLAAVATDAGISSYHAVVCCGQVEAGHRVGIIGFGGLGSIAAQIALARGAAVFVAELQEAKQAAALSLGASGTAREIAEFTGTRLDVIIDCAGTGATTAAAIGSVRPGGRVVQVGLAKATGTIDLSRLTLESLTLVGSSAKGDREDLRAVFELMAEGRVRPDLELISFAQIGSGFDRLVAGAVAGRLVATPSGEPA
jgi:propanol-preferring alcohol dehydrogenase